MSRSRIEFIYSVWVVMVSLQLHPGVALADPVVTNKPCVDITSDKPYGFPLTIECPFSVDPKLLDEAAAIAKSASKSRITKARAGNLTHPGWCPGVVFSCKPHRTNEQSVSSYFYVYFSDTDEKRTAGKASCGRDLVTISSASLRSSIRTVTNEVFEINDRDMVVNVRCVRKEKRVIEDKASIYIVDVPLVKKFRSEIQSLLQSLDNDNYLAGPEFCEVTTTATIAGKVYPGDEEKEIIPKAIAKKAFAKIVVDDDLLDGEVYEEVPLLRRGRWNRSLQNSNIEYHAGTGVISVRCSSGKYSATQSSFSKIDGVWIKVRESMVCF